VMTRSPATSEGGPSNEQNNTDAPPPGPGSACLVHVTGLGDPPANVNVAAALALAGIGPVRTKVEIWADPGLTRNVHIIHVEADAARFTMRIENVPSEDNPKTGKITPLSMVACLRGLVSPLKVGS